MSYLEREINKFKRGKTIDAKKSYLKTNFFH